MAKRKTMREIWLCLDDEGEIQGWTKHKPTKIGLLEWMTPWVRFVESPPKKVRKKK